MSPRNIWHFLGLTGSFCYAISIYSWRSAISQPLYTCTHAWQTNNTGGLRNARILVWIPSCFGAMQSVGTLSSHWLCQGVSQHVPFSGQTALEYWYFDSFHATNSNHRFTQFFDRYFHIPLIFLIFYILLMQFLGMTKANDSIVYG